MDKLEFGVASAATTHHSDRMLLEIAIRDPRPARYPHLQISGSLYVVVPGSRDESVAVLGERAIRLLRERLADSV